MNTSSHRRSRSHLYALQRGVSAWSQGDCGSNTIPKSKHRLVILFIRIYFNASFRIDRTLEINEFDGLIENSECSMFIAPNVSQKKQRIVYFGENRVLFLQGKQNTGFIGYISYIKDETA